MNVTSLSEALDAYMLEHLGNSRAVFERHYRDMRLAGAPKLPGK